MSPPECVALAPAVVAVCALFISIWQGLVTRKHARLSAKPIIETELNSHATAGIKIYNCGLGPAVLTKIHASIDGESYDLFSQVDHKRLVDVLIPDKNIRTLVNVNVPEPRSTIGAGQTLELIALLGGAKSQDLSNHLAHIFREMRLEVSYESIYEESFIAAHNMRGAG